jgi:hypothetical protein
MTKHRKLLWLPHSNPKYAIRDSLPSSCSIYPFQAPPAAPIDAVTSPIAPVFANDEIPIVKLPEKSDCPPLGPTPPFDISEVGPVFTKSTTSDGELNSTESGVADPPPCPTTIPPIDIDHPPQPPEQQGSTSEVLPGTVRSFPLNMRALFEYSL